MKKLLKNRGLVEREGSLRKGGLLVFLRKIMFSLLLEDLLFSFLFGKYSYLL